jgi:hypothetical protein
MRYLIVTGVVMTLTFLLHRRELAEVCAGDPAGAYCVSAERHPVAVFLGMLLVTLPLVTAALAL